MLKANRPKCLGYFALDMVKLCSLPMQCNYAFRAFITINSEHFYMILVFIMETKFVSYEVRTHSLFIITCISGLHRFNFSFKTYSSLLYVIWFAPRLQLNNLTNTSVAQGE
jgi:hypothetical protein